MDLTEFEDIAPFNDAEADAALSRLANHPNTPWISRLVFPDKPASFLSEVLRNLHTVDEFQHLVMSKAVEWVISTTMTDFTYEGLDNILNQKGKYLAMSNHRDIILDPAIVQVVLMQNNLPTTEICVGDNLLKQKSVELLIRSNRLRSSGAYRPGNCIFLPSAFPNTFGKALRPDAVPFGLHSVRGARKMAQTLLNKGF